MDALETMKENAIAHGELRKTKYQPVHTGRDWATEGPLCDTKKQAQEWLDDSLKWGMKGDRGHINEIEVEESTAS